MNRSRAIALAALGALAIAAVGCGSTGSDPSATGRIRTVEVDMVDMAFEPAALEVEQGETVRFVFTNEGTLAHDAFIGDQEAQAAHGAEMTAEEPAGHGHGAHGAHDGTVGQDDAGDGHGAHAAGAEDAVLVAPGDTATLTHTFDEPGTVEIGCHQPGHYEAGMKAAVDVA